MKSQAQILNIIKNRRDKIDAENLNRRGFYLVHSTGRYFISEQVCEQSLQNVCNKILTDSDYDYWIDYSFGLDVKGCVHWSNIDQTDKFLG